MGKEQQGSWQGKHVTGLLTFNTPENPGEGDLFLRSPLIWDSSPWDCTTLVQGRLCLLSLASVKQVTEAASAWEVQGLLREQRG